jgi:hypothetical protein
MAEKNVYQVADWNGQSGERWVAYQALWNEIDRPLERFRPIRANHFNPNKSISLSGY